jgi:hypothetical protein
MTALCFKNDSKIVTSTERHCTMTSRYHPPLVSLLVPKAAVETSASKSLLPRKVNHIAASKPGTDRFDLVAVDNVGRSADRLDNSLPERKSSEKS